MSGGPGLIIIQLDGLSYPRLRDGIARGLLPTLGRWLRDDTHLLHRLDSGLPSQTSSAQATLLYGVPDPPPGFRWFDRAAGRARTSRSPADLRRVLRAWPEDAGLLRGGAAIATAWPAGAARHALVLSEGLRWSNLRDISRRGGIRPDWPQGARGSSLAAIVRGVLVAGALDSLTTAATVKAISSNHRPVFATLLGYDQVAHHAGLDAPMTAWALRRADDRLAAVERALGEHDKIAVFADHGLSSCVSLRGKSLGALIVGATGVGIQGWHVAPSGNLAHVYARSPDARASLGRLVSTLVRDEAIGFVVHEAVAHGRAGRLDLVSGAQSGLSPLLPYRDTTRRAQQLAKLARHPDAGDLIVMGAVDAAGRVVAFERQRAAHGGLGGAQSEAFAVLPASIVVGERLNLARLRQILLENMSR